MAKSPALPRLIKRAAATLLVAASVVAATVHVAPAAGSSGRHVAVCAFCWDERR